MSHYFHDYQPFDNIPLSRNHNNNENNNNNSMNAINSNTGSMNNNSVFFCAESPLDDHAYFNLPPEAAYDRILMAEGGIENNNNSSSNSNSIKINSISVS